MPVQAIVAAVLSALDLIADIESAFLRTSKRIRPVEYKQLLWNETGFSSTTFENYGSDCEEPCKERYE